MLDIKNYIDDFPNFPIEGVLFRDITPILKNPEAYNFTIDSFIEIIKEKFPEVTHIVAPESRGFWIGCPVAAKHNLPLIPVRKPGKLPGENIGVEYSLEYGNNGLFMRKGVIKEGDKIVIIDDILATGGTLRGMEELCEKQGAKVLGSIMLIELLDLKGKDNVKAPVYSLVQY
ncbi:MAG: adenine phosphoribosyltransferase [Ruminococcaceae bacterium]|nr:adenine phosphoribosyltransferase [Oscillospiraceae bacterium]